MRKLRFRDIKKITKGHSLLYHLHKPWLLMLQCLWYWAVNFKVDWKLIFVVLGSFPRWPGELLNKGTLGVTIQPLLQSLNVFLCSKAMFVLFFVSLYMAIALSLIQVVSTQVENNSDRTKWLGIFKSHSFYKILSIFEMHNSVYSVHLRIYGARAQISPDFKAILFQGAWHICLALAWQNQSWPWVVTLLCSLRHCALLLLPGPWPSGDI